MENESSRPVIAEMVEKNIQLIKKAEIITLMILVLGLVTHFLGKKDLEFILIIGSVSTAIVYFLLAFSIVNLEDLETTGTLNSAGFVNFIYKLTFLSLSIAAISLLSLSINNQIFETAFTVSGLTILLVLILSMFSKINEGSNIYNSVFYIRLIVALIILLSLANNHYHWI